MRLLITLLLLLCHNCVRSLPVQSQALENSDDQFFWQQAWFSSNDKPDSPFTSGDSKKITAKSIFITPNFAKPQTHYCPPGYLIDDSGKCIKVVSVQQPSEELLTSRLINLISTDNFFDYDYDDGEQATSDEQANNLPALVPILNENAEDEGKSPMIVAATESSLQFFPEEAKEDDVEIVITTLSNDNETVSYEHATVGVELENATEIYQNSLKDLIESSSEHKVPENSSESSLEASNNLKTSYENSSEETSQKTENLQNSNPEITSEKIPENISQTLEENSSENSESSTENFNHEIKSENDEVSQSQVESTESSGNPGKVPEVLPQPMSMSHSTSSESFESSVLTLDKLLYKKFEEYLKNTENKTENLPENQNVREIPEKSLEKSQEVSSELPEIKSSTESSLKASTQNSEKISENSPTALEPIATTDMEIFEHSTDAAISESSDSINSDADTAFLLNDSLISVDDKNNSTDFDYSDAMTTLEPFGDFETAQEEEEKSEVPKDDLDKALDDDRQNENKFVYHHSTEPTTTKPAPLSTTTELANKLLRFPSADEEQLRHRVRFPDDDEEIIATARQTPRPTSFSWPREPSTQRGNSGGSKLNKLHITRFWNDQPFMNDNGARGNSKNFRMENFVPFVRKVQILTPQRYNYRK